MIFVHLANGFEEIEALTIVDVLRRGGLKCNTVSIMDTKKVTGAHGITVEADLLFSEGLYRDCSMIVLPGGMPGTLALQKHSGLAKQLLEFASSGKKIAAICAAPMVLGGLGILDGLEATIYPSMENELGAACYKNEKVVVCGNVITSQGPATAMEFALTLVGILSGKEQELKLRKDLLLK